MAEGGEADRDTSDLRGRVALVTGASGGIGGACARRLAAEGLAVAAGYVSDREAAEAAAGQAERGLAVEIDVRSRDSVEAAFKAVEAELGPVEILVNAAGITRDQLLPLVSDEDWEAVLETNLSGAFRCTRRAIRGMIRPRFGRIVTLGSVSGIIGTPGQASYAASKAGLVAFSRSVAREVAGRGITVNVVIPGLVDTEMTRAMPDAARTATMGMIPLKRMGEPDEVADAIWFCVSSPYVTAQTVVVDGGLT